jgi:hypothetical protein
MLDPGLELYDVYDMCMIYVEMGMLIEDEELGVT